MVVFAQIKRKELIRSAKVRQFREHDKNKISSRIQVDAIAEEMRVNFLQ